MDAIARRLRGVLYRRSKDGETESKAMKKNDTSRVLVLAAGRSTRMKSEKNKLLHDLRGVPILARTLANASRIGEVTCVVGRESEEISALARSIAARIVIQDPPRGTGHAVLSTREALEKSQGDLIILNGDVPLAGEAILTAVVEFHRRHKAAFTVVSTEPPEPASYGRIIRRGNRLHAIREFADADEKTRGIREINAGIYCAKMPLIFKYLLQLKPDNQKYEYYLTDLIGILNRAHHKVVCMFHPAWRELLGINDRTDIEQCESILNLQKIRDLQKAGVGILSSATTFIDDEVSIGPDTVIHPFTCLEGKTTIGRRCCVKSFSRIVDSTLADDVTVQGSSLVVESCIENGSIIGPFCHLRGSTRILEKSKVGNFVEMKKTTFGPSSKAMHLSYLGDATIEEGVNIGAGTITCNYDGVNKNPTHIEKGVFIGSGTEIIAPLRVGEDAYVAAGSTITDDVPAGSLAIARARQVVKKGWAAERKKRMKP